MQTIPFPAYPAGSGHSLNRGGSAMEIKHTHPQYTTEEQRMDKLQETRNLCLAAIGRLRAKPDKRAKAVRVA